MDHKPVMTGEIVSIFAEAPGGVFIDATYGLGGHTKVLISSFRKKFEFIGIDRDGEILGQAERDRPAGVVLHKMRFSEIPEMLRREKIEPLTGILFDLGLNSAQLDDPSRGFSYSKPASLDMRFDRDSGKPAAELLQTLEVDKLIRILKEYGQQKNSRAIARAIIAERPTTTESLASLIRNVVGSRRFIKSGARVFQALRIFINDELEELQNALSNVIPLMAVGGRLAVISYHSLEDRIVKRLFLLNSGKCFCGPEIAECSCGKRSLLEIKTKKPQRPSEKEIMANSRARPARLRYAERI
ncbi:MAG: 16S rRNA (cytosine(1402)-N(4))-methyltransferase RsmH [candidate division Zixibacteria bacterium]